LEPVLDTLVYLKKETNVWFEITTLLIPTLNDSESEIDEMTKWIMKNLGPDVPLHFTAFHPAWKIENLHPTPPSILFRARTIAKQNGLHHVYTGNIQDNTGGSTYCHRCNKKLIGRNGYILTEWNIIKNGVCKFCETKCEGVFCEKPGTWGAKRLPARIK